MSKIIIGIHGLGNKLPRKLLKKYWKMAIKEGLFHCGYQGVCFKFELVYWADILHPEPLNPYEKDKNSPLYVEYPYIPIEGIVRKQPNELRKKVLDFIEDKMDKIFLNKDMSINFSSITDAIIHHYFKDLDMYYSAKYGGKGNENRLAKELIREKLRSVLDKYENKQILLISHSMGSIVAFEVLSQLPQDVNVDTFVTIGSPLGQPVVMGKIYAELNNKAVKFRELKTPGTIKKSWFNLSDLEDKITINYNLADDYNENQQGIGPIDKIVYNSYVYKGKRNPHKSYGYLRTPELAEIIYDFLARDRNKALFWLTNKLNLFKDKFFLRREIC